MKNNRKFNPDTNHKQIQIEDEGFVTERQIEALENVINEFNIN